MFYADLHVHSRFSRATSREGDLPHLADAARTKGITLLGTGDFTHPGWFAEIRDQLEPAEPGLFRLRPEYRGDAGDIHFMLQVEISTIYKKDGRTRKVHHLVYAPGVEEAGRITSKLARIGNLASDGRPILGLDSRDLLEIVLDSGEGCFLVPAHAWTPHFSVLGSVSGFDAVDHCYGDLSNRIFAIETGLSSDPPMNERLSALDRFTLISNSDAHSPSKLGRECCSFDCALDYFTLKKALETRKGFSGTVEFFPEEGKYHLDGHRACNARMTPAETRAAGGRCPGCGKPVTVGVLSRVEALADRAEGTGRPPELRVPFRSFIPLVEIVGEVLDVGSASRSATQLYEKVIKQVGPELHVLERAPLEDIRHAGSEPLEEAIRRMREGRVIRDAGYDGVYGTIRLFEDGELEIRSAARPLFDSSGTGSTLSKPRKKRTSKKAVVCPPPLFSAETPPVQAAPDVAGTLDPDQRVAVEAVDGPVLVIAGPGAGKTRVLAYRIAHLVNNRGVSAEHCLAVTFTRRAADEMRGRLRGLLGETAGRVSVHTFHSLGLELLREFSGAAGLTPDFRVISERERMALAGEILEVSSRQTAQAIEVFSNRRRNADPTLVDDPKYRGYRDELRKRCFVDFDDLIELPAQLMESDPKVAQAIRDRHRWISADEFQDVDAAQYRLVKLLAGEMAHLCVIGDPDQSIYGFRGADVQFFLTFTRDFPNARTVQLNRNYRARPALVAAANDALRGVGLVPDREMAAVLSGGIARISLRECESERSEADFAVQTVQRLIGGADFHALDRGLPESEPDDPTLGGGYSFSDIAVLVRTEAQAQPFAESFARAGIPFVRRAHGRVDDNPVVRSILDALTTSVGATLVDRIRAIAGCRTADTNESPEAVDEQQRLTEALVALAERAGNDENRFRSDLALGVDADLWDPRAQRVALLTIHAAKGLEFRTVFLAGCEDGVLPLRFGEDKPDDLAEERRLFFVGMTRAKDRLYLTHARKRAWRGPVRRMAPSPFLAAIREELLKRERDPARARRPHLENQLDLFT